ncbi:PqqD family protein [Bacillus sp. V3B]|uniref:PqqD family protein n=1 Tax=Bacillus sp. V3B TaxID=2804915 RepID=UPI00210A402D|nr:PqqD family protein [Bacillus sp. V3B]MCQ6277202.1 PqqD family protein [Bacillus sp. V3B]
MDQYIRKKNYETTSFDGEWIVLNTDNYTITRLNETGGFCWSLLGEAQSVQSLSKAVARKFALIELKDVEEDIVAFLENLIECGLVDYASV